MHVRGFISWLPLFLILLSLGCPTGLAQTAVGTRESRPALPKRKTGDPLEYLPAHIEVLTSFGERADISPDSKRVAFMAKTFGDAMVIDLQTKTISCLTCNIPAAAFLRVMHLATGDYLLIGPDHFEDVQVSKRNRCQAGEDRPTGERRGGPFQDQPEDSVYRKANGSREPGVF